MTQSTDAITPRDPMPAEHTGTEEERLGRYLAAVAKGLADEEGHLHIGKRTGTNEWVVGMEWGKEAEDSPMAGAAAYGMGETLVDALGGMLDDTGWLRR